MLEFLENIFKKTFLIFSTTHNLRSSTSHDGSTSPFVACDASTEFWEPCLGTCNGPSRWYGTRGGWLKNKNGLFGHGCIYEISNICINQNRKMRNSKNLELQLNLNLFKIYDTVSCMLMYACILPCPHLGHLGLRRPKICSPKHLTKFWVMILGICFIL